jgi:hypothetical protein
MKGREILAQKGRGRMAEETGRRARRRTERMTWRRIGSRYGDGRKNDMKDGKRWHEGKEGREE